MGQIENREDYLKWRNKGVGGSDVPALFGHNKYLKVDDLLIQKVLDIIPLEEENFVHALGHAVESEGRSKFSMDFQPKFIEGETCFIHPKHSFLRCTVDGWGKTSKGEFFIWEHKLVSWQDFKDIRALAKHQSGEEKIKDKTLIPKIPDKYLLQIIYQALVCCTENAYLHARPMSNHFRVIPKDSSFYVSLNEEVLPRERFALLEDAESRAKILFEKNRASDLYCVLPVKINKTKAKSIIKEVCRFWKNVRRLKSKINSK